MPDLTGFSRRFNFRVRWPFHAYRTQIAEGDLLVSLAEAEGTRLENNALQAAGASNLVGLEMADALENIQVIVVPTDGSGAVNPLDLDALLRGW